MLLLPAISDFTRPHDLRFLLQELALSPAYAGLPGDEEADTILIRDDWVRKQIQVRTSEFSTSHTIKIRVGSFNVNGQLPDPSIANWIRGLSAERTEAAKNILESPDILILGFQELDLSTGALLYSTSTILEEEWTSIILSTLNEHSASYVKFASRQLVGMLILGFVRKGQRPYIAEISTTSLGTGLMGMMGNKGAVGLRFRFRSTVITCVCSHLPANDGMGEKRNYDYLQISHRMQFPVNAATPAEAAEPLRPVSSSIFETHILLWEVRCHLVHIYLFSPLLDLNYRLHVPTEEVLEMSEPPMTQQNITTLLHFDELLLYKHSRSCFDLFQEMPITFPPTYRYLLNSDVLDSRRRPAWTDRIQHLGFPTTSVRQANYTSHREVRLSDHKPVSANYEIETITVDPELQAKIVADLLLMVKDIFKETNSNPRIQFSERVISFGDVRYLHKETRTVTITNNGDAPCAFRIVPAKEGEPYVPPWIIAEPAYGVILPQHSFNVDLHLMIGPSIARVLNTTTGDLESILIVHVEHGLDYFLGLSARFLPTCFARNLESLATFSKPIREYGYLELVPQSRAANIPKEFMRVIDWLMSHPLSGDSQKLFQTSSPPELLHAIRESLDTGSEFTLGESISWSDTQVTQAFGEVLLHFFEALPRPIVPPDIFPPIIDASMDDRAEVWVTLFAFLQFACLQSSEGASGDEEVERIAAIFAPLLVRETNEEGIPTPLQKRDFIKHFLSM
ncbi:hypothetical protein FRC17_009515 [Serendipita sp. 399]|nr:hypothetical protein FRC17_009515 [Serendipita sp. 399]